MAKARMKIPESDAPIEEIWQFAKKNTDKFGGFNDWSDWVGWGSWQFIRYNETKELPYSKEELLCFLALMAERSEVSGEFYDDSPDQVIPRAVVTKLHKLQQKKKMNH